jgi:hypothetical protein
MGQVLVNIADWDGPAFPPGWAIVNAPRPLLGEQEWTGHFRHGVFYAAAPKARDGYLDSWAADDAWPVVFITNEDIEDRVLAKFREYGYASAEEAGVTIAEQAGCMGLPWHEDAR